MSQTILLERRHDYLLTRFSTASKGHRLTATELGKRLQTKEALKLGFDKDGTMTSETIQALLDAGLMTEEKKEKGRKSLAYRLTEEGIARLKSLPSTRSSGIKEFKTHDDQELLRNQKAFILLHAQREKFKGSKMRRSDLNATLKSNTVQGILNLDAPTTNWVLSLLRDKGQLKETTKGGGQAYELTDDGVSYFSAWEQHPKLRIFLTGDEFNKLLAAIREAVNEDHVESPASPEATPSQRPLERTVPSDLSNAILEIVEELLREHYAHLEMVPIHAIRRRIAEEYGPEAARHDNLDPQIHRLRQDRRLRMVAIGDLSEATDEQLEGSIRGANETFFYVKVIHEPARI